MSSEQTEGAADAHAGDGAMGYHSASDNELTLLDLLLILARRRKLIGWVMAAVLLVGVGYALVASEEYTSEAKVVRESQNDVPDLGNIGGIAALQGFGMNLGGAQSGLTPQAFPSVLQSREVRLAVVRDTFSFPDTDRPMTFVNYVNQPPGLIGTVLDHTLKLPQTISQSLRDSSSRAATGVKLHDEEYRALKIIRGMVSSRVDQQSGLMTISVSAEGQELAAEINRSFVQHLTGRVRELRTKRVREKLGFIESRFQEAQDELENAENRLAQFLERNQNPTTAQLQFQRDRLQRQVRFKEQLYSNLQGQLTQSRLDLQRQQPVVMIVESPVPPAEPSAPNRPLIVFLSVVLGAFFGVAGAFVASFLSPDQKDQQRADKVARIRDAFMPRQLIDRVRQYFRAPTS